MFASLYTSTIFLIAIITCFTIPGLMLISKNIEYSFWEKITLGTIVGFVAFSLLYYLTLIIHIPLLVFIFIAISILIGLKTLSFNFHKQKIFPKKQLGLFLFVYIIGIIGQLAVIAPSGIMQNGNLVFWSSHAHDASWHLALMNEIQKGMPLQNPDFAGFRLVNYHFFSDLAPAFFNYYFKISALDLYFRFFPIFYSLLLGASAYIIGNKMGGNFLSGIWSMIFVYFVGSFGYIVTFIKDHSVGGESIFWASQIQSSIGNPPQIASLIVVMAILIFLINYLHHPNKRLLTELSLLIGCLVVFKVYAGVVVFSGLGIISIWQFFKDKSANLAILTLISGLISALLYLPNTSGSAAFLIWQPWWYIRTMVVADNRLNWLDLELRRQTYLADHNYKRVLQVEFTAFFIFLFGNLGMRVLGFWQYIKIQFKILTNYYNLFFVTVILVSFTLPLLFLQKGVASNSIQFLQYFLLLMGILGAIEISRIITKIKLFSIKVIVSILILLLAIPTQIGLLYDFYHRPPFTKINADELQALSYLQKNIPQSAIIITPPYNKYLHQQSTIPDIWAWSDSSYVAAFSNHVVYLADTEQVDIMGYSWGNREKILEDIFTTTDTQRLTRLLISSNANYLYFSESQKPKADLAKTPFTKEYNNQEIEIWKIQ